MNWGNKIFISFIVFIGIMATMVTICYNQQINLVAKDYYVQEIAYEQQIQKIKNFNSLDAKPEFSYDPSTTAYILKFDQQNLAQLNSGVVHFFRPSDYTRDRKIEIAPGPDGIQTISLQGMQTGRWKVKIEWENAEKGFYTEKDIVL